jgi:hypothetical protein
MGDNLDNPICVRGLCKLKWELELDLELIQHSAGDDFLHQVSSLALKHRVWDHENKYASINVKVLVMVFRLLRPLYPLYLQDRTAFEIILKPPLLEYSATQSRPLFFDLTPQEATELLCVANWMMFVLAFIPGGRNKTLVMAVVCALSDIPPYKAGGGATVQSRRLEALFHVRCGTPKSKRDRARKVNDDFPVQPSKRHKQAPTMQNTVRQVTPSPTEFDVSHMEVLPIVPHHTTHYKDTVELRPATGYVQIAEDIPVFGIGFERFKRAGGDPQYSFQLPPQSGPECSLLTDDTWEQDVASFLEAYADEVSGVHSDDLVVDAYEVSDVHSDDLVVDAYTVLDVHSDDLVVDAYKVLDVHSDDLVVDAYEASDVHSDDLVVDAYKVLDVHSDDLVVDAYEDDGLLGAEELSILMSLEDNTN